MGDIDEAAVRRWRKERPEAGKKAKRPFGPVAVAKAYRLLYAIFTTAVNEDRMVRRNLATFADLRWGELAGLRRENIDLDACEIRVAETVAELDKGGLLPETPKPRAGRRTVAFPAELVPELRWHLERFAEDGPRGVVFIGPQGGRLRRSNFRVIWTKARESVGLPGLHFHDLRHTGGTLSVRDWGQPQGADGPPRALQRRAAMIYQHATRDRDRAIAQALVREVREGQADEPDDQPGLQKRRA
jgi:integrase